MMGLRYKSVNFGAENSPVSPNRCVLPSYASLSVRTLSGCRALNSECMGVPPPRASFERVCLGEAFSVMPTLSNLHRMIIRVSLVACMSVTIYFGVVNMIPMIRTLFTNVQPLVGCALRLLAEQRGQLHIYK